MGQLLYILDILNQTLRPKKKNVYLLYHYLPTFNPPVQNFFFFFALLDFFFFFFFFFWPHFPQKITIFPLCSYVRKKKNVFLHTYPTQKYRVGVQQTNKFLRMALAENCVIK